MKLNNEFSKDKKVLLRERKRHTDRSVSSTPSVILYKVGYPPHQGTPPSQVRQGGIRCGVPPVRVPSGQAQQGGTQGGVPPCQGTPHSRPDPMGEPKVGTPLLGYPPGWMDLAGFPFPPRRCGLTNKVKLLPSLSYYVRGW